MDYYIRDMYPQEYPLLADFLYEAIYQRNDKKAIPKTIINDPALQIYIKDFGTLKDDFCLCATVNEKVIGAVWVRNINGYGNTGDDTPEFALSLLKDFRGKGIGTELMRKMLLSLKTKGYHKASLAVQKENDALRLYQKVGFHIIRETESEYIMEYLF